MQEHYFDQKASHWDDEPRRIKLAHDVAESIIKAVHPTAMMDVMDFGCGTGLLTLCLQPFVRSITGVDSSPGMLEVFREKVRKQGIANVTAMCRDLEKGEKPEGRYHLIVSSMTLHHVAELEPLFRHFFELLLPGGTLCLADLDKEDGTFHEDPSAVRHHGFDRSGVAEALTKCGLSVASDEIIALIRKGPPEAPRDYPVFLISARKSV